MMNPELRLAVPRGSEYTRMSHRGFSRENQLLSGMGVLWTPVLGKLVPYAHVIVPLFNSWKDHKARG